MSTELPTGWTPTASDGIDQHRIVPNIGPSTAVAVPTAFYRLRRTVARAICGAPRARTGAMGAG